MCFTGVIKNCVFVDTKSKGNKNNYTEVAPTKEETLSYSPQGVRYM